MQSKPHKLLSLTAETAPLQL